MTTNSTTTATDAKVIDDGLLKERVSHYMAVIKDSIGGPQLDQSLNAIGAKSSKRIAELRSSMQAATDDALPSLGKDSELATIINEATIKTTELNPNSVTNSKLYKLIPLERFRKYLLRGYVENFQSESGKVQSIFDNLIDGKEHLLEKMIMLQSKYRELKETQADLTADMLMADQLKSELEALSTAGMDDAEKAKHDRALNRVARKRRDMETKKAAITQFFMSIDEMFNIQQMLTDSIDSILDVGPLVLQNAILLHSVIDTQKQIIAAAKGTQDAISASLEANARLMKKNASDATELYNSPTVALTSFEKSFADLEEAVRITREAQAKGTGIANEMTDSLKALNDKFAPAHDDDHGAVIDGEKA